jgi:hypothetical protein
MWWPKLEIPTLGRLRHKDLKFKARLGNIA